MKVFINDRLISILKPEDLDPQHVFDMVIDHVESLEDAKLVGRVLILDDTPTHLNSLLERMQNKNLRKLVEVYYVTKNYKEVKAHIKTLFKIVKAAGGLVIKDDKVLMMNRLSKWDLPKGKLEKDEESLVGAIREVEEECNISVQVIEKLCHTRHTYVLEGSNTLKKTTWYLMECMDDSAMRPQIEEDITELRWMNSEEYNIALQNSYATIQHVFKRFRELKSKV
jgi:8-oxo-dGTP pyrophosphatase MutT (NUDIX family)